MIFVHFLNSILVSNLFLMTKESIVLNDFLLKICFEFITCHFDSSFPSLCALLSVGSVLSFILWVFVLLIKRCLKSASYNHGQWIYFRRELDFVLLGIFFGCIMVRLVEMTHMLLWKPSNHCTFINTTCNFPHWRWNRSANCA